MQIVPLPAVHRNAPWLCLQIATAIYLDTGGNKASSVSSMSFNVNTFTIFSHAILAFSSSSLSFTTGSCSQIWDSIDIIPTQHVHFFMQKDQATIVTLVRDKTITVSGQMALFQPHRRIHAYSLYRSLDPRTRNFGLFIRLKSRHWVKTASGLYLFKKRRKRMVYRNQEKQPQPMWDHPEDLKHTLVAPEQNEQSRLVRCDSVFK